MGKPYQALFGVIQGAQYEDLRRKACQDLGSMPFDGFGIGGALEKENLGTIVRWCAEELPNPSPATCSASSEPDDIFVGIENGVTPSTASPHPRGTQRRPLLPTGRYNITNARFRRTSRPSTRAATATPAPTTLAPYLRHLFKADERLAATLASIHNERFIVRSGRRPQSHQGRHLLRVP